jgi:hypothetical protein
MDGHVDVGASTPTREGAARRARREATLPDALPAGRPLSGERPHGPAGEIDST